MMEHVGMVTLPAASSAYLPAPNQPALAPVGGGWHAVGVGPAEVQAPLPSVGQGRELGWARSWSELSGRMRSVGVEVDLVARKVTAGSQPADVIAGMGEMLRVSKHLTETSVQFQLATGLVTNAATAVNKLLTQQ